MLKLGYTFFDRIKNWNTKYEIESIGRDGKCFNKMICCQGNESVNKPLIKRKRGEVLKIVQILRKETMKSSGGCRNVTMNWKQNKEKQVKPKMFEKNNHPLEEKLG